MKHHFIPAFSLRPWAGSDGLVCQMRLINGRVVGGRTHPNATGLERDLYKTDGLTAAEEHHLEENFFKPIDTAANQALQKMLAWDKAAWTSEMRSAWTRYLLSLRFRNPDTVKDLKTHMIDIWSTARESIKKDFAKWRRPDDPDTWEEFEKLLNPAAPHIGATNMVMRIVDNDRVGPTIFNMTWWVQKLVGSKVPLLTSDRPLDWPAGLANPKAYIALAISPDTIFVAANDPKMQHWAESQSHTQLAKDLNKAVVTQAREYVWGTDNSHIDFVRKHFGKAAIVSAISAVQKAASLRAAAGEN